MILGAMIHPEIRAVDFVHLSEIGEEVGFRFLWAGDSQLKWREVYTLLGACAVKTKTIRLGISVTNLLTRHFTVTADGIATLDELSNGRAALGIGLGDSSVRFLGMQPLRLDEFERTLVLMKRFLSGQDIKVGSTRVRLGIPRPSVPVYVAATGPRTLRLAGRVADGVLISPGAHLKYLKYAIENVTIGAEEAGRDPRKVDLVAVSGFSVSRDRDEAFRKIRAESARALLRAAMILPPEVLDLDKDDITHMRAYQDAMNRVDEEKESSAIVNELFSDFFIAASSIVGQPEECADRLDVLSTMGINQLALRISAQDKVAELAMIRDHILPRIGFDFRKS